jgi:predicted HTH domain antitoxin
MIRPGTGQKPYNPQRPTRVISIGALAEFVGKHRNTVSKEVKERGTDLFNAISVLEFVRDTYKKDK